MLFLSFFLFITSAFEVLEEKPQYPSDWWPRWNSEELELLPTYEAIRRHPDNHGCRKILAMKIEARSFNIRQKAQGFTCFVIF